MDFTGAQMVLTLKLISVAVCYQDGLKREEVSCCCAEQEYLQSQYLHWFVHVFDDSGYA